MADVDGIRLRFIDVARTSFVILGLTALTACPAPLEASSFALLLLLFFRFRRSLGLQQGAPIRNRDLIIVRMDFVECQEAVAVAAIVDKGSLQGRLDACHFRQIDVAPQKFASGGFVVELLDAAVPAEPPPGFLPGEWHRSASCWWWTSSGVDLGLTWRVFLGPVEGWRDLWSANTRPRGTRRFGAGTFRSGLCDSQRLLDGRTLPGLGFGAAKPVIGTGRNCPEGHCGTGASPGWFRSITEKIWHRLARSAVSSLISGCAKPRSATIPEYPGGPIRLACYRCRTTPCPSQGSFDMALPSLVARRASQRPFLAGSRL